MELETIMLSEISQEQKDKYTWSHIFVESEKAGLIEKKE
jgi:hypothetical protein